MSHKYEKIHRIGEGAHGMVFFSRVVSSSPSNSCEDDKDEYVAIKKIRLKSYKEGLSQEAVREIKYLIELDHPNIMKILDIFHHGSNVNMVLEYMESDLESVVKDPNIVLTIADIKSYMMMLLKGVEYCHQNFLLHRDIKPGNCLISSKGILKLADFGLARFYNASDRPLSHNVCTLWYRSPELLFGINKYDGSADMWAVGCIFAELFLRVPIFMGKSELDQLKKIFEILGSPSPQEIEVLQSLKGYTGVETSSSKLQQIFFNISPICFDLLKSFFCFDPSARITASQALNHPFFTSNPLPTDPSKLSRHQRKLKC